MAETHVFARLLERGISQACVMDCACAGAYPDDMPLPSALVFTMVDNEPLHVMVAFDEEAKKSVHYHGIHAFIGYF